LISTLFRSSSEYFNDLGMSAIILTCSFVYLILAERRAYKSSWLMSAVTSLGLIGVVMIAMQLFRAILFFTTFYTVPIAGG